MTMLEQWAALAKVENARMRMNLGYRISSAELAKLSGRAGGLKSRPASGPQVNADRMLPVIVATPGITMPDLMRQTGMSKKQVETGRKLLEAEGMLRVERAMWQPSRYYPTKEQA